MQVNAILSARFSVLSMVLAMAPPHTSASNQLPAPSVVLAQSQIEGSPALQRVADTLSERVTVGPMIVAMPRNWVLARTDGGTSTFSIANLGLPNTAEVAFAAVPDSGGSEAAVHEAIWGEVLRRVGRPAGQGKGRHGRFVWSEGVVIDPRTGRETWFRLYGTKELDQHVTATVEANSRNAFSAVLPAFGSVLTAAQFGHGASHAAIPGAAPAAMPGSQPATPASPPGDIPIVEAHVHIDTRGVTMTSNVLTDHILFFANGLVAREGVITGPRECYALYNVGNLRPLPRNYGRWQEDKRAGIVRIQWEEGPPWVLQRESDRLSLGGRKLLPLRAFDGLKLDGLFVHRDVGGPVARIALSADGRFEAAGLQESMTCWRQAKPGAFAGAGRYEIRKWTLILRFADGRSTFLPMHFESAESLQHPAKFLLNGRDFVRGR